jgi:hypothetical protein
LQLSQLAGELRTACEAEDIGLARDLAERLTQAWGATSTAICAWVSNRSAPRAA